MLRSHPRIHRALVGTVVLGRRALDVTFVVPKVGRPFAELGVRWVHQDPQEAEVAPWLDGAQVDALIAALRAARERLAGSR